MKIRLLTILAGPNGNHSPGDVLDLPAKEARELVDGGYAVAIEAATPAKRRQTATRAQRETRSKAKEEPKKET